MQAAVSVWLNFSVAQRLSRTKTPKHGQERFSRQPIGLPREISVLIVSPPEVRVSQISNGGEGSAQLLWSPCPCTRLAQRGQRWMKSKSYHRVSRSFAGASAGAPFRSGSIGSGRASINPLTTPLELVVCHPPTFGFPYQRLSLWLSIPRISGFSSGRTGRGFRSTPFPADAAQARWRANN